MLIVLCALLLSLAAGGQPCALERVPAEHATMARDIRGWERSYGRTVYAEMAIMLPHGASDRIVFHELAHLVAYDRGLNESWEQELWHRGRPRGRTPTRYGRNSPREDLAESYAAYLLCDRVDTRRVDWLARWLPELRAARDAGCAAA